MTMNKRDIFKGLLAGILIGIGAWAFLSSPDWIGACLFSLGLISVFILDFNLYTGKVGFFNFQKKKEEIKKLLIIVVLNIIGITFLALIAILCNPPLITSAQAAVGARLADTFIANFLRALIDAIMCGVLIHLAVVFWKQTKNLFLVVLPIMIFILCGFEHCIADVFYFVAAGSWDIFWFIPVCILGNAIGAIGIQKMLEFSNKE